MNTKLMVEEWLTTHKYDGLCNTEVPCGCLLGDLAPCGDINGDCRPGYREEVDSETACGCDGQGEAHWHVTTEAGQRTMIEGFLDKALEWKCECGERCDPSSSKWRWNGAQWEHHHGYPVGHVVAEHVGPDPALHCPFCGVELDEGAVIVTDGGKREWMCNVCGETGVVDAPVTVPPAATATSPQPPPPEPRTAPCP